MFVDSRGLSERRKKWLDRTNVATLVLMAVAWVSSSFWDNEQLGSCSVVGVGLGWVVSLVLLNGFRFLFGLVFMMTPLGIAIEGSESEVWNQVWFWVVTGACEIAAVVLFLYAGRKYQRRIEEAEKPEMDK